MRARVVMFFFFLFGLVGGIVGMIFSFKLNIVHSFLFLLDKCRLDLTTSIISFSIGKLSSCMCVLQQNIWCLHRTKLLFFVMYIILSIRSLNFYNIQLTVVKEIFNSGGQEKN